MAWDTGSYADTNAGNLITVLDAQLPLNAHWEIFDAAAGTNCKVYHQENAGENSEFYVKVDDNYTGYAIIELWEGWDAGAHAGIGTNIKLPSSTYTFRINRPVGGWRISVLDNRFIIINANYTGTYIGQPRRYDVTKNMPMICAETTGTSKYNSLAYWLSGANVSWMALFDEGGTPRNLVGNGGSAGALTTFTKCIDGIIRPFGESAVINSSSQLVIGTLEGVVDLGQGLVWPANNDVLTIAGEDYVIIGGSFSTKYFAAVREY